MSTSPAWELGEWDLQGDLTKIEQQWAFLDEILRDSTLDSGRPDEGP
jgi:hypothetical protein